MTKDQHYSLSRFLNKKAFLPYNIGDRQILSDHSTRCLTAEQRHADQLNCEIHRSPTHQGVADTYTPALGCTRRASLNTYAGLDTEYYLNYKHQSLTNFI